MADKAELEELLSNIKLLRKELCYKSCLSNVAVLHYMNSGEIIIRPFNPDALKSSSYDVTLGSYFYREWDAAGSLDLLNPYDEKQVTNHWMLHEARTAEVEAREQKLNFGKGISPADRVIIVAPGETVLAHTNEFIGGRTHITTMMKARSSLGRNFIEICKCAGWGDVGYFNRWTMEITNNSQYSSIPLVVGRRVAQIIFFDVGKTVENTGYETDGKYQTVIDVEELERSWTPEAMIPKLWKDKEVVG